jgi:DNA helicase II / ATP-dependent DNA helicase PcrA
LKIIRMHAFKIDDKRNAILASQEHLLVEGGPGSGKTTVALLKASEIIHKSNLHPNSKILFLSFARTTIVRIEEHAKDLLSREDKRKIEITTYHSFCWSVIQSYASLLYPHPYFKLIMPPSLAAQTAGFSKVEVREFIETLLAREGTIGFDLFAPTTARILDRSAKIRKILSTAYPYIIVDEFQDTDDQEWKLVKLLGESSTVMALADLEQRIYGFRSGVSATRISDFISHFPTAERFDLGKENNRSEGTDIAHFGNDLLTGANRGKAYKQVKIVKYPFYSGDTQRIALKTAVLDGIKRLKKTHPPGKWSIAILVKSKVDTLMISNYLSGQSINHEVIIDPAGPALAAAVIAGVLEPALDPKVDFIMLLKSLVHHIKGRKNDKPSQKDLELAAALEGFLDSGKIIGTTRKKLITGIEQIVSARQSQILTGAPETDWLTIRRLFQDAKVETLRTVYEDARYLKLLHKGAVLSEALAEMWRASGYYLNARSAIEDALTQEHFSMTNREWKGIYIMNIHKSKGKEFDEVIIWEEPYKPIVHPDSVQEGTLLLRVAITRARSYTTLLTPARMPCILL